VGRVSWSVVRWAESVGPLGVVRGPLAVVRDSSAVVGGLDNDNSLQGPTNSTPKTPSNLQLQTKDPSDLAHSIRMAMVLEAPLGSA